MCLTILVPCPEDELLHYILMLEKMFSGTINWTLMTRHDILLPIALALERFMTPPSIMI